MSNTNSDNTAFGNNLLSKAWNLWCLPKIDRRRKEGMLGDNLDLVSAQVLFPVNGKNKVYFNEEVRGTASLILSRDVKSGDPVTVQDAEGLRHFDLPDELLDHGHLTIVRGGKRWFIFLNFMRRRAQAKDLLELAADLLDAAQYSKEQEKSGPAIDNIFWYCRINRQGRVNYLPS